MADVRDNSPNDVERKCGTPTCDRTVSDAEFCPPCMQSIDYGAGVCHNMVHPCDHHRKTYGAYLDGKRDAEARIIGIIEDERSFYDEGGEGWNILTDALKRIAEIQEDGNAN